VPDKEVAKPDEPEYVTGFKLVIIVASVALACFLMLLDTMIISTVCLAMPHRQSSRRLHGILVFLAGNSTHYRYLQLSHRRWMVRQRVPVWEVKLPTYRRSRK
jgi:hypothetical protein